MDKPDTRTAICQKCEKPFEVKARYSKAPGSSGMDCTQLQGRSCPPCKKLIKKHANARHAKRMKLPIDAVPETKRVAKCQLIRVAEMLKMSERNASKIEKQALAKIRSNPELVSLFKEWMRDGGRVPDFSEPPPEKTAEVLLDFMMGISDWYRTYGHLVQVGKRKEAVECMNEIRKFYKTFKRNLSQLPMI